MAPIREVGLTESILNHPSHLPFRCVAYARAYQHSELADPRRPIARPRDSRLVTSDQARGLGILVELASLELGNPHPEQVAADGVPLGQAVERLDAGELLSDLPLELDRDETRCFVPIPPRSPILVKSKTSLSGPSGLHLRGQKEAPDC
jgi:hypothetical protein